MSNGMPRGATKADGVLTLAYDMAFLACVVLAGVFLIVFDNSNAAQWAVIAGLLFAQLSQSRVNKILGRRTEIELEESA